MEAMWSARPGIIQTCGVPEEDSLKEPRDPTMSTSHLNSLAKKTKVNLDLATWS